MSKLLRDRWATEEFKSLHDRLLKWLRTGTRLESVSGLQKFQGRWDLRGFEFPRGQKMSRLEFIDTDLSHAVMTDAIFVECSFIATEFVRAKADGVRLWSCKLERVSFIHSNLTSALMNAVSNGKAGWFKNVLFSHSNLRDTSYSYTLFEECVFDNANLKSVDFGGSRFIKCKFKGKIVEVVFRGNSSLNKVMFPGMFLESNPMIDVDFTDCVLESAEFIESIDLGSCQFPESKDYLFIEKNRSLIFNNVRSKIDSSWSGSSRELAILLIDRAYLNPTRKKGNMDFIDSFTLIEVYPDFGQSLFDLIRDTTKDLNG